MLGDPYAEKLAPIYDEFLRWKELIYNEFQSFGLRRKSEIFLSKITR